MRLVCVAGAGKGAAKELDRGVLATCTALASLCPAGADVAVTGIHSSIFPPPRLIIHVECPLTGGIAMLSFFESTVGHVPSVSPETSCHGQCTK